MRRVFEFEAPIAAVPWLGAMPWTPIAVLAYLSTITLGTLSLRGRRINRAWHTRLFILTALLTLAAAAFSFPEAWPRGAALTLAVVPLALLPFITVPVSRHTRRHMIVGLSAAPCYLAALVLWAVDLT